MITKEIELNLYSDARLSKATYDFIEHIKFHPYDLETNEKFELINHVNNTSSLLKKIFSAQYEVGFCESVPLSQVEHPTDELKAFNEINERRRSIRKYHKTPLTFLELSNFLQSFYRLTTKETLNIGGELLERNVRNIASGGGLYPTEIFIVNLRLTDLKKGVYHYNVVNAQLDLFKELQDHEMISEFFNILMHNEERRSNIDFENASVFVIFSSVINKLSSKYQDFGVALSLIEIGQFVHSAYLTAATLNLACCPFGGMLNDKMRDFLDIYNTLHHPVICMALGNKAN